MKTKLIRIAVPACMLLAANAFAGDLDAIIEDCNGCHGDDGVSQWTDMPTIAGISEFVHAEALYVYLDEERPCAESDYRQGDTSKPATTMCAVVAGFDDETIEAIAAHYAALPWVPAKQDFDAGVVDAGKTLHDELCEKCHTDGGSNPEDDAGILSGQWIGYLESTFAEYAADERDQPRKMRDKMEQLSEADTKALIHYYASQQ